MVEVSKLEEKIKKLKEIGKEMRLVSPYEYKILAKDDNLKVDCIKVVADFLNETSEVFNYNDPLNTLNNILPKLKYVEDCPYSFEECLKYEKYYVPVDLHKNFAKAMHAIYECLNNVKSQVPEIEPDLKTLSKYLREVIEPKLLEPVTSKLHNAIVNICKELPTPLTKIKNKVVPPIKFTPFTILYRERYIYDDPSKVDPYFDTEYEIPSECKTFCTDYVYRYLPELPTRIECVCPDVTCTVSPSEISNKVGDYIDNFFYTEGDFTPVCIPEGGEPILVKYKTYCKGWCGTLYISSCNENFCYTDKIYPKTSPCMESLGGGCSEFTDYSIPTAYLIDVPEKGVFELTVTKCYWESRDELDGIIIITRACPYLDYYLKICGEKIYRNHTKGVFGKYLLHSPTDNRITLYFRTKDATPQEIYYPPSGIDYAKGRTFPINFAIFVESPEEEVIENYSPPIGKEYRYEMEYHAKFKNYKGEIILLKGVKDPITEFVGDVKIEFEELYYPEYNYSRVIFLVGFAKSPYRIMIDSSFACDPEYPSWNLVIRYIVDENNYLRYVESSIFYEGDYYLQGALEFNKEYLIWSGDFFITFCKDGLCITDNRLLVQKITGAGGFEKSYIRKLNWE